MLEDTILTRDRLAAIFNITGDKAQVLMKSEGFPAACIQGKTYVVHNSLLQLWIIRNAKKTKWMTFQDDISAYSIFEKDESHTIECIITSKKLAEILSVSEHTAQTLLEREGFPATHVIDNVYVVHENLLCLWVSRTTPVSDWMSYNDKCSIYPAIADKFNSELRNSYSDSNSPT